MCSRIIPCDESLDDANPFLRQNGVVTTMYNFFGYTSFNGFMEAWADQGLVSPGWAGPDAPLVQAFNHGIKENVWQREFSDENAMPRVPLEPSNSDAALLQTLTSKSSPSTQGW